MSNKTVLVSKSNLKSDNGRPVSHRYFAHTTSDNGNPIGSYGRTKMQAIMRLEARLHEDGDYGTITVREE